MIYLFRMENMIIILIRRGSSTSNVIGKDHFNDQHDDISTYQPSRMSIEDLEQKKM